MPEKTFVLVVEDDTFYASVYRAKLAKEGFEIEVAENGDKALERAKKRRPDLMLLDLIMPGKDGFETLADFRKEETLRDLKIIVLSNLSQEEDIARAKSLGATEYVIKSNVSLEELMKKIKQYVA